MDRIDELFADGKLIDEAMRQAVRDALLLHKKMGVPIVEWRDGKVVWTPPEEIDVDQLAPPGSDYVI